ncbi:MAG: hypothetical protein SFV15_13195 [Polyangiaceae bacterium]|nr:hypothetical protein [Polyangiaceae bacterium]
MQAHRIRVVIPSNHQLTVRLPSDVPTGAAEIIVLTESPVAASPPAGFLDWLDNWIASLPPSPAVPLHALRRENLYE